VQALPTIGAAAEPALTPLLQLLPKADPETRARVLGVFAGIGAKAKAALPEVQNHLKDSDPGVRAAALAAFAKIEEPAARVSILLAGLDDTALPVRKTAALELAALGDRSRDATSRLTALLQHDDERDFAFDALRQISPRSVPDLITMLKDRDLAVQVFATQRLAKLGPDARDAIPALEAVLQRRERSELKNSVTEALKRINPKP
ncbi:MAG: HEAT repeat domain-containing protein, partial [Chthoniobacteraceae bacterium]